MFDKNSGSPKDRRREKGWLNSAKTEIQRSLVEDKRHSRSAWKTEEEEEEETEEGRDETGGGPIGRE